MNVPVQFFPVHIISISMSQIAAAIAGLDQPERPEGRFTDATVSRETVKP